ncbi:hypothetical protein Hanom_Chr10g00921921 [Helianthus anomalus]
MKNERIGITLAWTQTRKGTGQEDARKQTRTQTLQARLNFLKIPQADDRVLRGRSKDGTRTGACANM